jgi:transposase-like protein
MKRCPNCNKTNSKKAGLRKNKSAFVQRYFCNECKSHFVDRKGFERMRTKPEIIIDALDLRAKGLSFGKIKDYIYQKYNHKVTRATILNWQTKFGGMIKNFTKSFQLSHSENVHADEVFSVLHIIN